MVHYYSNAELNRMSYEKLCVALNEANIKRELLRMRFTEDRKLNRYIRNLEARLRNGNYKQISYTAMELLERIKIPYKVWDNKAARRRKDETNDLRIKLLKELFKERSKSFGIPIDKIKFSQVDEEYYIRKVDENCEAHVEARGKVIEFTAPLMKPRLYRRAKPLLITTICVLTVMLVGLVATNGNLHRFVQIFEYFTDFVLGKDAQTGEVEFEGDVDSLQDFFKKYKLDHLTEPRWLPDGYVQQTPDYDNWAERARISTSYANDNEEVLFITAIVYEKSYENYSHDVEKSAGNTKFTVGDIVVSIVPDIDRNVASWNDENSEFFIEGVISNEDIEKIVRSMYPEE